MKILFALIVYTHVMSGEVVTRLGTYETYDNCRKQADVVLRWSPYAGDVRTFCIPVNQ